MAHTIQRPSQDESTNVDTRASQSLTEDDAARYIGMSRSYLRQARLRRRGPAFIRIGRAVRYRVADLDAFMTACRVQTKVA